MVGAVLWRGVVYRAVDGLLLSAFPILAVFAAAGSRLRRDFPATAGIGAVAILTSLVMTAAYLGYSDFRSGKLLVKPVVGDLIWSVPTLATLNPVDALIAHAGMHVTTVVHSYETDTFLPPHQ